MIKGEGDGVDSPVVRRHRSGFGLFGGAEGAEGDATITELAALGCDLIQGYSIARPAPIDQVDRWLRARSAAMAAVSSPA